MFMQEPACCIQDSSLINPATYIRRQAEAYDHCLGFVTAVELVHSSSEQLLLWCSYCIKALHVQSTGISVIKWALVLFVQCHWLLHSQVKS